MSSFIRSNKYKVRKFSNFGPKVFANSFNIYGNILIKNNFFTISILYIYQSFNFTVQLLKTIYVQKIEFMKIEQDHFQILYKEFLKIDTSQRELSMGLF